MYLNYVLCSASLIIWALNTHAVISSPILRWCPRHTAFLPHALHLSRSCTANPCLQIFLLPCLLPLVNGSHPRHHQLATHLYPIVIALAFPNRHLPCLPHYYSTSVYISLRPELPQTYSLSQLCANKVSVCQFLPATIV